MEKELRKVTFSLMPEAGFAPDEDQQKELDELSRKRDGLYHGDTEVYDDELKKKMFIVEDLETGEVHYVEPYLVTFKKEVEIV